MLSIRAYGRRRGVSHVSVIRAIDKGTLSKSVGVDARGQRCIADPDLADREWEANTDLSQAPIYVREQAEARAAERDGSEPDLSEGPDGVTMSESSAAEKYWKAKHAELKFKEAAGELVSAADVKKTMVNAFVESKTHLLGLPSRAKQAIPHLTTADIGVLETLIRESLEALSESES